MGGRAAGTGPEDEPGKSPAAGTGSEDGPGTSQPTQTWDVGGREAASGVGEHGAASGVGGQSSSASAGGPADSSAAASNGPLVRRVIPRWVQLVLLPLAIVALWALAHAAGKVLMIFIVAGLIGLILNPAVAFVQHRARLPRGLAVLAVYLGFFVALAGIGFLLANPISNQVQAFVHNVPGLVKEAEHGLEGIQSTLNKAGAHVKLIGSGKTALQTFKEQVVKSSSSLVSFGGGLITEAAGAIVDLVLVFVVSVYVLLYGERIGSQVRRSMPPGDGTPADDYPHLVQRAVSRYVGGQLLFSTIMGVTAGVALYIYGLIGIFPAGRTYAVAFGAFLAAMELIPYLGPVLGALPPVLVALFTDPVSALWVALLFLALQQLEGHVVAPQIFGHTLRINPLLVIFALLVGEQLYGLIGALVALPIVAVLRETFLYLRRHTVLEPWSRSPDGML